jgi:putative hydrolase of the HAD superfamily
VSNPSSGKNITVVGLDADDTLWHSEVYFERTQRRFDDVVGRFVDADVDLHAALNAVERRNLVRYGYGIKGFTLSMIECAIEVTDGAIGVEELGQVLAAGRAMLDHPVDLIDGVDETVTALADAGYRLVIVTKGDLHHQEMKVMASGLAGRVERVEIVSEKDTATYRRVIASMDVEPHQFAMVGNSVKSDVLPVIEAGGHAVHIPYHITWEAEHADHDGTVPTLDTIRGLPAWLASQA